MPTSRLAVCFEQIEGNYWYGAYGDFRVIMMKDCGWVNVSRMCASGGKQFQHWKANDSSKRLMNALQNLIDQEACPPSSTSNITHVRIPTLVGSMQTNE